MRSFLKVVFFLGFVLTLYLCIGYSSKGFQQPVLVGAGAEYHFWGFFILAILYGCACVGCAVAFILAFIIKRKKRDTRNFGI